jgi:hypothetical protein
MADLDDWDVKGIRNQADDQIMLCNCGIEGFLVCYIEGSGVAVLNTFKELLDTFEGSASFRYIR